MGSRTQVLGVLQKSPGPASYGWGGMSVSWGEPTNPELPWAGGHVEGLHVSNRLRISRVQPLCTPLPFLSAERTTRVGASNRSLGGGGCDNRRNVFPSLDLTVRPKHKLGQTGSLVPGCRVRLARGPVQGHEPHPAHLCYNEGGGVRQNGLLGMVMWQACMLRRNDCTCRRRSGSFWRCGTAR